MTMTSITRLVSAEVDCCVITGKSTGGFVVTINDKVKQLQKILYEVEPNTLCTDGVQNKYPLLRGTCVQHLRRIRECDNTSGVNLRANFAYDMRQPASIMHIVARTCRAQQGMLLCTLLYLYM
jgi:hypothetical protein